MKTAFLIGPRTIELRDTPEPEPPPDGLVLEMRACGVCGSDLRRWREGPPAGAEFLVQGHELAGLVLRTGARVRDYRPGDRLAVAPDVHCGRCYYCERGLYNLCPSLVLLGITPGWDGGFAEQVVLPGKLLRDGIVHRLPDGLDFHAGALAETLSSVLASHDKIQTGLGEIVTVMGAGPVGCLHIAVARARGAAVIVTEPNAARRSGAAKFEPDAILDPGAGDVAEEVRRLTRGIGADAVICANPVAATQTQAVRMTRRGGRIVLFGGLPKSDPMTHLDANLIHYGELAVIGAFSYHPRFHAAALETLRRKTIRAEMFVTHVRPLAEVAEAFADADAGVALKVVVEPK